MDAAEKGTATHLALEHLKFAGSSRAEDLKQQIAEMVRRKLMTQAQADVVDVSALQWFIESPIGRLIRESDSSDVIRELAFNLALAPQRFPNTPASLEPLDQVMLRGRIDLLVRKDGAFIVVDYKTDRVSGDEIDARKAAYALQVQVYREAIETLLRARVIGVYLIFLSPRVICEM
jgi:ATP-dependent helicase/nuclease subunit A